MRGRGRTIAGWSAATGLLTLATAGFLSRDSIREAWHIHKLETGYAEEKAAAAERLGELRSAQAAPSLVEQYRLLCAEAEAGQHPKSYKVFQDALRKVDRPSLLALVRAVPRAISMAQQHEDGCATFCWFVHETIEANYLGTPPELLFGSGQKLLADLQRILESMRNDARASPELRQAAAESLKAFP